MALRFWLRSGVWFNALSFLIGSQESRHYKSHSPLILQPCLESSFTIRVLFTVRVPICTHRFWWWFGLWRPHVQVCHHRLKTLTFFRKLLVERGRKREREREKRKQTSFRNEWFSPDYHSNTSCYRACLLVINPAYGRTGFLRLASKKQT